MVLGWSPWPQGHRVVPVTKIGSLDLDLWIFKVFAQKLIFWWLCEFVAYVNFNYINKWLFKLKWKIFGCLVLLSQLYSLLDGKSYTGEGSGSFENLEKTCLEQGAASFMNSRKSRKNDIANHHLWRDVLASLLMPGVIIIVILNSY